MSPRQAVVTLNRIIDEELRRELAEVVAATGREAVRVAKEMSGGPFSQSQLTAMGHPYAVAERGQQRLPPEVINVQTGAFQADWREQAVTDTGDSIAGGAENSNPVAAFMHGTKWMVPRPIEEAATERIEPEFERAVERAVEKALQGRS